MPIRTYRTESGLSVEATLKQFGEKAAFVLGKQLYREAQGIISESMPLVPVDTGALRSSAYVTPPEREGDTVKVELGYGGPAARINPKTGQSTDSYAVFVHENLEAHHPVGQALYLQVPFVQAQSGMSGRIADGMRDDLSSGASSAIADITGEAAGEE